MIEKINWLLLFVLAGFVVCISAINPNVIIENAFLAGFLSHEVINSMIVMVTVTLAVGFTLIEKAKDAKRIVKSKDFSKDEKDDICNSFDSVIRRIKRNSSFMVLFLLLSILFLFMQTTYIGANPGVKSFLLGCVIYMFVHSIILMVEMYRSMYNWWSPDDFD